MDNSASFTHSDLAYEKRTVLPNADTEWQSAHGIEYREESEGTLSVASLEIKTDEGAKLLGKPKGKYVTLFFGRLRTMDDDTLEETKRILGQRIRELVLCPREAYGSPQSRYP